MHCAFGVSHTKDKMKLLSMEILVFFIQSSGHVSSKVIYETYIILNAQIIYRASYLIILK